MVEYFDLARVNPDGQTLRVKMLSLSGGMTVVAVWMVLRVQLLRIPEARLYRGLIFDGNRLTAQRQYKGDDEFSHGVALPCVMGLAVHLVS